MLVRDLYSDEVFEAHSEYTYWDDEHWVYDDGDVTCCFESGERFTYFGAEVEVW